MVTTVIPLIGVTAEYENNKDPIKDGFILDQMQTRAEYYHPITKYNTLAQAFIPTMSPLVKLRLYIGGDEKITEPLTVSIRESLIGQDLTKISLSPFEIPAISDWINFDFPDITVTPEQTYYIVLASDTINIEYRWLLAIGEGIDYYERGSCWVFNTTIGHWINWDDYEPFCDLCFKTYSYIGNIPDLDCEGIFGWPDQKPNGTVNDSFTISNIGDEGSLLNWEITEKPDWGIWTFTPEMGYDLTPEDGPKTIDVSVIVPDEQNEYYSGEIKIVNKDNNSDYCTISVSLSTQKTKEKHIDLLSIPLIQNILKYLMQFRFNLTPFK
jgi:hypothetical protein